MAFEKMLEEYAARRATALGMGGPAKLARRQKAGQLNARQRIAALVDHDSFIESGSPATYSISAVSRNGARASSELAMVQRSVLTRRSSSR